MCTLPLLLPPSSNDSFLFFFFFVNDESISIIYVVCFSLTEKENREKEKRITAKEKGD
jgi:hypothetical protein